MPAVMTGQTVEDQLDDHIDQEINNRCRQKNPDLTVTSVLGNDLVRPAHDIHNADDVSGGGSFQEVSRFFRFGRAICMVRGAITWQKHCQRL